ncbi:MAG: response regulator [Gemmatimonadetes bacterium]|nr:response regulator [Gemmatimonadota bacterium]MBI2537552.1 response regulator [Gemmatimonadota bacterium]MBI2616136.1 response regulator [Gemmatimonadota bacterium]
MTEPLAILVVDDEPAIRRALERALKRWGHTVHLATSGEAACEILGGYPVDFVLMDLRMPGMSGQTLFHSIVARWPHLVSRVVVMTGDPEAEDHHDWLRHHDLPMLMKPFELAQLELLVRTVAAEAERNRSQG